MNEPWAIQVVIFSVVLGLCAVGIIASLSMYIAWKMSNKPHFYDTENPLTIQSESTGRIFYEYTCKKCGKTLIWPSQSYMKKLPDHLKFGCK